jgi:NAD(P)-dependent dehydrogenase (short-subunit alcohol dehydrogenase family)
MSKWGVIGLTKSVAKIRVNTIAPQVPDICFRPRQRILSPNRGVIATALTDFENPKRDALVAATALGRIGPAEETARANLF